MANVDLTEVSVSLDFPKNGIQLDYIEEFYDLCGGIEKLVGLTTDDVCKQFIKPLTEKWQCSFCEFWKASHSRAVKEAEVFISHAWKYQFLDVMNALKCHFRSKPNVVIWFDLFANNQHKAIELDFRWWCTTFQSAIEKFGHTVMVFSPWKDPIPLTRAWCLFELYATEIAGSKFEIAMSPEEQNLFVQDVTRRYGDIDQMLSTVDVRRSECFKPEDKSRIFEAVEKSVGFSTLNGLVFKRMRVWVVETILSFIATNPDDLSLKMALATVYNGQGQYGKAEEMYLECVEKRKRTLGEDHPDTLESTNGLGHLYLQQEQFAKAEAILLECLEKRMLVLGENQLGTLFTMNNLALVYTNQGQFDKAEPLFLSALRISAEVIGVDHPLRLVFLSNLAFIYRSRGQYDAALPYVEVCFEKNKEQLGEDHPNTLIAMNNLASVYDSLMQYQNAEPLYLECIQKRSIVLGPNHPETLITKHNYFMMKIKRYCCPIVFCLSSLCCVPCILICCCLPSKRNDRES